MYYPKLSAPSSALRWSLASLTSIKSSISSLPSAFRWRYFFMPNVFGKNSCFYQFLSYFFSTSSPIGTPTMSARRWMEVSGYCCSSSSGRSSSTAKVLVTPGAFLVYLLCAAISCDCLYCSASIVLVNGAVGSISSTRFSSSSMVQ